MLADHDRRPHLAYLGWLMTTFLVFILILMGAVLVHELAHYLNARSVGVPVRAFSVGMGPVIARWHWRGTEWRVSLFPLGGYVDLPGLAPKVDEEGKLSHPDEGLAKATLPEKLWVLVGGVLANFTLGVLLLTAVLMLEPNYRSLTSGVALQGEGTLIVGVVPGSAAESLGLEAGDRVLAFNGLEDPDVDAVVQGVRDADRIDLVVDRGGERLEFSAPWRTDAGEAPRLGVELTPAVMPDLSVPLPRALGESLAFSVTAVPEMVRSFAQGFGSALSGRPNDQVAGPVGIVTAVNQATRVGLAPVLFLAALINLSLAVFNLLPIPGLDGGRMLLATVVALRGRPFRPGQEETLHFFGIMAVIALIVIITFNEISGLISG